MFHEDIQRISYGDLDLSTHLSEALCVFVILLVEVCSISLFSCVSTTN